MPEQTDAERWAALMRKYMDFVRHMTNTDYVRYAGTGDGFTPEELALLRACAAPEA